MDTFFCEAYSQISQVGLSKCPTATTQLKMQDLCLDALEQLSILSLCQGVPAAWGQRKGQKAGKMPTKMGSSGSCLPACLTSSDGWALHQEQSWGFWGAGMGVRKIAPAACLTSSDGGGISQEHILGVPGSWDGGQENCSPDLRGMASKNHREPVHHIGSQNVCWTKKY
eukprot:CAMPEP_0202392902 /NCGR_PEP_ID=MMETSP1127-20130417/92625_1 /ASSEMBLY_ACC=CAM_ASM_000462 /TAXON_ID=3047 /ORGANISM="Dunaliella tertiolecta, Strain CCMP1320" /LENGTH=168 /DNA_ID=CAMNT_0048995449 /DNA_START=177 /DNA_END=683 /DNA_ORIENTATION=+